MGAGEAKAVHRHCGNGWHCERDAASVYECGRDAEGKEVGSCSTLLLSKKKGKDISKACSELDAFFSTRQGMYHFHLACVITQATPDYLLIQQLRKQTCCTVPILVTTVYGGTKLSAFGISKEL